MKKILLLWLWCLSLVAYAQDADTDGIPDTADLCPGTPSGTMVNAYGCPLSKPTCDYTSASLSLTATGGSTGTGILTRYVLADSVGKILQVNNTPTFTGLTGNHTYMALAITYSDDNSLQNLTLGQTLASVSASCFDWSIAKAMRVCVANAPPIDTDNDGVPNTIDLCPNTPAGTAVNAYGCPQSKTTCDYSTASFTLTATGGSTGAGILTRYVLADSTGKILQVNNTPTFTGLAGHKTYMALALTYQNDNSLQNLTAGQMLAAVSASCFDWSDAKVVKVCAGGGDTDGDGVPDDKDLCPNTPAGTVVNEYGCPINKTTCDYTTASFTLTATGGSTGAGILTRYVLADSTGKILQVNNTPTFSGLTGSHTYMAVAITYQDNNSLQNLAAGQALKNVSASCFDWSDAVVKKVCVSGGVQPPVAVNDINQTIKNVAVSGNVLTNDSDPQGLPLTASVVTNPANGTLTLNPNGSYTYTPNPNFVGTDIFTYKVCNSANLCTTATVTIAVSDANNGNYPPVANDDQAVTLPNQAVTIIVQANDFDPDGQPLSNPVIVAGQGPKNGTVTVNANGTVTYTPNGGFLGTDSFLYQVCDNFTPPACDTARVTVTVLYDPVGNQTWAFDDAFFTAMNIPVSGNLLLNDQDLEGNTQTASKVTNPAHGSVVVNPNGTFTYTPALNYAGPDSFKYRACDNGTPQACDTATVYLLVIPPSVAVDLSVAKRIDRKLAEKNDLVTFTVRVYNPSKGIATNLQLKDSLSSAFQLVPGSVQAQQGTYNPATGIWDIGTMTADSLTLTYQVKLMAEGVYFNQVEIVRVDQRDPDSTPANGIEAEDDFDRVCVSVPFKLCPNEKIQASVPAQFTNVRWFKNSVEVAAGNTVLLSGVGVYTYTASNQTCPAQGCCPVIIEASTNCCSVQLCIPMTITKRRK
jgi:uncharacterized repeat protein (TIGR01451 family)